MESFALLVVAILVGSAASQVYHDEHPGYFAVRPNGYYGPLLVEKNYRSGQGSLRGDSLRKKVQETQESGLDYVGGSGGSQLVHVGTEGKAGYVGKTAVKGSSGAGAASVARSEGFGKAGKAGYGGYGAGGYKKGHSNTGFHKSYSSVQSGKDSSYVDEDHKEGAEHVGASEGDSYGVSGREGWEHGVSGLDGQHSASGHSLAGSRLGSSGLHKTTSGEEGKLGRYTDQDFRSDGHIASDHQETIFHKPIYYY